MKVAPKSYLEGLLSYIDEEFVSQYFVQPTTVLDALRLRGLRQLHRTAAALQHESVNMLFVLLLDGFCADPIGASGAMMIMMVLIAIFRC